MADSIKKNETLIVNLFGGPGTGKSTMAAGIFSELKWRGVNCELATEYAKEKVWEEAYAIFENQVYILGKQLQRIVRVLGKVDVVVTDSPILLVALYNRKLGKTFDDLIMQIFHSYENMNFFLMRKKKYLKKGRTQTLEEALELDVHTKDLLDRNKVTYTPVTGEKASIDIIVKEILKNLGVGENETFF
ncbi:MAG: AAA family ATPase [Spirochaetales bacterium]|nr:AAA family ATPase [Spirochaetales bacterium]